MTANLVNVLSGEIYRTHVAVDDGRVIGLGDYKAKKVINLKGAYLAPSLIDGHFHVESSMLTAREFAREFVQRLKVDDHPRILVPQGSRTQRIN